MPISAWVDEIRAEIAAHQVIVVAGETGSGKTTQLPKICLTAGLQRIGHTQPRRLAARSVAERIAEELDTPLGELVGFQVRFTRKASAQTRLKLMTDGVLLAELTHDPDLRRYDCIIIDEAHERSLNIDFLLGYLKQLLPRRPDLKVIVTSATIDTARFAEHFADAAGTPAPIIEVSGRTFPVEVRYRPLEPAEVPDAPTAARADPRDQIDGICDAVSELRREGSGDILVFLSGEREIRDTADALTAMDLRFTEIVPLYARLSAAEQHRVFSPHTGTRIVLATNVAETSITVPGIRYVIDPGTARISRYSTRTKVQRLPIEPISQASANQRAGRCGRVAPGICIRLYAEDDFTTRPEFTEPEILRTNLASVILQMTDIGLGDIAAFPFVEPPDSTQVTDGIRLLTELGALQPDRPRTEPALTRIGHRLSRIPLDPRLGRMLLEAETQGCLAEVSVIVAGMTVQDPRERPTEHREAADAAHRRFWAALPESPDAEPAPPDRSDFLAYLRMWQYLKQQRAALSGNAFRRLCRAEYLNFLRIREWQDLNQQLREICADLKLTRNQQPAPADRVHVAILSGLLSQIGLGEVTEPKKQGAGTRRRARPGPREYLGARGAKFAINPGSSIAKKSPDLVMAAELVETTRLWARTAAGIEAGWVEEVGGHLIKRTYSEPHWSQRSGTVQAYERLTLLGVPIVANRAVDYARINPVEAREIFLRSALVEGQWHTRHHFFARNQRTRAEAEELADRSRRRDLMVDDETIYAFYDARVPGDITSQRQFDTWWRKKRQEADDYLDLKLSDLVSEDGAIADEFPDTWTVAGHDLPVNYIFDPGSGHDGATVSIRIGILNQIPAEPFTWQVPGLRTDLATELIRGLPKAIRTNFVPAPDHARKALARLAEHPVDPERTAFPAALGAALTDLTGVVIPADAWHPETLDPHLRVRFEILDGDRPARIGEDLAELKTELATQVSATLTRAAGGHTRRGATDWEFGEIPEQLTLTRPGRSGGPSGIGYPGLVDEGTSVALIVHDTPERRAYAHRRGLRRLVRLNTPDPTKWVVAHLSNTDKLALGNSPYASVPALLADARLAAVGELIAAAVDPAQVRTEAAFRTLCDTVRADQADRMRAVVATAAEVLRRAQQVQLGLAALPAGDARTDLTEQLGNLVFDGFLSATEQPHLDQLPRYLHAMEIRLQGLRTNPAADERGLDAIWPVEDAYAELCAKQPPGPLPEEVRDIGWAIEELRVSLFAQGLGTRYTVSPKRILNRIAAAPRA